MFINLINVNDFIELYVFYKRRNFTLLQILSRIFSLSKSKVESAWSHLDSPPTHWWDIPQIRERWNLLISGNPKTDYYEYFIQKYLFNKEKLTALSLGCGTGHRELRWAASGKFKQIDAIDLSPRRIDFARKKSMEAGYSNIINYQLANFNEMNIGSKYDLIFCEQSLHHFSPMNKVIDKINDFMKPDGLLLINEYVGPTRFQWNKDQIFFSNKLLGEIPAKYRYYYNSRLIKKRIAKPGLLRMFLSDPSEAIESEKILPELNKKFRIVELREYGGTILHPLFDGIAHNFINEEKEALTVIEKCFSFEDELLHLQKIKSDFIFAVFIKNNT